MKKLTFKTGSALSLFSLSVGESSRRGRIVRLDLHMNYFFHGCIKYALFCILLLSMGCKAPDSTELDNTPDYEIDLSRDNNESGETIIDYLKNTEYIQLETNERCLLASLGKIRITKDRIIILDIAAEKVLSFDLDGRFQLEYSAKGGGPGEYKRLGDFDFDYERNLVLILAADKRSILEFKPDGTFVRSVRLSFPTYKFSAIKNGLAFFVGYFDENNTNLRITNKNGEVRSSQFPFPNDLNPMVFNFTGAIISNPSSTLYCDATSSSVYAISSEIPILKYKMNFGSNTWPEERRHEFSAFMNEISGMKLSYLNSTFYENENAFVFRYTEGNRRRKAYFLKKEDRLFLHHKFKEDLMSNIISMPIGWSIDGRFVSYLSTIKFEEYMKQNKSIDEKYRKVENLLIGNTSERNPTIVLYDFGQ